MRFTRQGQSCTAATRIFVHENIFDGKRGCNKMLISTEFVKKFEARINQMKMGNPLDETTDMGTVVSKSQLERIQKYIELGSKEPGLIVLLNFSNAFRS